MKKFLLIIIFAFVSLQLFGELMHRRVFVDDSKVIAKIIPEKVSLTHIKFETSNPILTAKKENSAFGCVVSMQMKNSEEITVNAILGLSNYSWEKGKLILDAPHFFIILKPHISNAGGDPYWGDVIKSLLMKVIGFRKSWDIEWLEVNSTSKPIISVHPEEKNIHLTTETSSLLDNIIMEERPFIMGFPWYDVEVVSMLGISWRRQLNKRLIAFEIDPKGLFSRNDKKKFLYCKAQVLQ